MVTIGSQASGDTGLNSWTRGFTAALTVFERPASTPTGTAINVASTNPANTVRRLVKI